MSRKGMNIIESNLLLELCEKYKKYIECKKTDVASNAFKEEGWQKFEKEFNAKNSIVRDLKTLKTKYKNMKYATKSKAAGQRQALYGTGGGPYTAPEMTSTDEKVMSIVNGAEIQGIENNFDSDTIENNQLRKSCSPNVLEDILEEIGKEGISTPKPGPATLRTNISSQLRSQLPAKGKESKWDQLANIKKKWTESKFVEEVELVKKLKDQVDLQNKIMLEKHELEMQILRIKLEKETLQLNSLK